MLQVHIETSLPASCVAHIYGILLRSWKRRLPSSVFLGLALHGGNLARMGLPLIGNDQSVPIGAGHSTHEISLRSLGHHRASLAVELAPHLVHEHQQFLLARVQFLPGLLDYHF